MALRTDYAPCDPLLADDVNDITNAIIQNEHNIFELYLENYFGSLATPYLGLFFDGFSDTAKTDTASGTLINNESIGSTSLEFATPAEASGFKVGQTVLIANATTQEESVVTAVNAAILDATGATGVYSENDPVSRMTDQGVVSSKRQIHMGAGNAGAGQYAQLQFTFTGLALVSQTVKFTMDIVDPVGYFSFHNVTWDIDGTGQTGHTWTAGTQTHLFTATFTPASSTSVVTIQIACPAGNLTNMNSTFKTYTVQYGDNALTISPALSNAYVIGDTVKRTSTTSSFSGRTSKLLMTSGHTYDIYHSKLQRFQTAMESVRLWVTRKRTSVYNPDASIAVSATSLLLTPTITGEFATNDTVDIYDQYNTVRERKTLSSVTGGTRSTAVFDAATASASATFSHTTSGTNRVLAVWVWLASSGNTVSGITYAGVPMTAVGDVTDYGGSEFRLSLWKLKNPTSGANNVVITSTGGFARGFAQSFNSASDITSFTAGGNDVITDVDVTFPTLAAHQIGILGFAASIDNGNLTADAGVTNDDTGSFRARVGHLASGRTDAPTLGWTSTGSGFRAKAAGAVVQGAISQATLNFTPAIANAGGFATSAYVERVDVKPKVSVVDVGAAESMTAMTYVKSTVDFTNSETEDEYSLTVTPNEDVIAKLELTRNTTAVNPEAKRLGVALNT